MTGQKFPRLQFSFLQGGRDPSVPISRHQGCVKLGAWHRRFYTQTCNRAPPLPVIGNGVDALSITWLILTQARWLKLGSGMTMRRLARLWCSFTRWLKRWAARTAVPERRRMTV